MLRHPRSLPGPYYAVRVGYANAPSSLAQEDVTIDDEDGIHPRGKKRRRNELGSRVATSSSSSVFQIRSAIFLHWDDMRPFVQDGGATSCDENETLTMMKERKTIYSAFDSLEEAEAYLMVGEIAAREEEAATTTTTNKTKKNARRKKTRTAKKTKKKGGRTSRPSPDALPCSDSAKEPTKPRVAGNSAWEAYQLEIAEGESTAAGAGAAASSGGDDGNDLEEADDKGELLGEESAALTIQVPMIPMLPSIGAEWYAGNDLAPITNEVDAGIYNNLNGEDADPLMVAEKKGSDRNKTTYWEEMYRKLAKYKRDHGTIEIPEIPYHEKEKPEMKKLWKLRRWCKSQMQQQRRLSQGYPPGNTKLTQDKIDKLTELGFQFAPSYDEMYEKLAEHKAQHGTLDVSKEYDEELFLWTKEQKKMLVQHFQGSAVPLTELQIKNLESLGFEKHRSHTANSYSVLDANAEEKKWESLYQGLLQYKQTHGNHVFPLGGVGLTKPERLVMYWARAQRVEYKKLQQGKESKLTAQRLQKLAAAGFDLTPKTEHKSWEEHLQDLREFVSEHGHCRPHKDHPTLGHFVTNMRRHYRAREKGEKTPLTEERVNDLLEVGFIFKAGKSPYNKTTVRKSWEERFQDLLAFKAENGHCLVPQESGGPLGSWVKTQRDAYKNFKAGRKTHMTAQRALKLTEIGFCFDASFRFKGYSQALVEGGRAGSVYD